MGLRYRFVFIQTNKNAIHMEHNRRNTANVALDFNQGALVTA